MSYRIGYARVSTQDQNVELQLDALKQSGCEKIFTDKASGAKTDRPELQKMLEHARSGDTIVVWRFDRLSRSVKDLLQLADALEKRGIQLVSIKDGVDTSTATGRFFFTVTAAMNALEREILIERTQAGLVAARARGKIGGRPKSLSPKQIEMAKKMYDSKLHSVYEICKAVGISKMTLYRMLKGERK